MNILTNQSNEDYHADTTAISVSGLKLLARSPAHYWARYLDPERKPTEPTPAMAFGTAAHCVVLEPSEFDNRFVVIPAGIDRRTKEGKEAWAAIEASGKTPLKADDFDRLVKLGAAAQRHPIIKEIFSECEPIAEQSIYFTSNGVLCKCRPDLFVPPGKWFRNGLILDLKTTDDASPESFAKSVWNYGYHTQQAFYSRGFQQAFGTTDAPSFMFLAIEKDSPFGCGVYTLPDDLVEYAQNQVDELLEIYSECKSLNRWPGYTQEIKTLEMPGWVQKAINGGDDVEEIGYVQ